MADDRVRRVPKLLLGRRLKSLRDAHGYSREEIAKQLRLKNVGSVRRFEIGETVLGELSLEKLCDLYDLDSDTRENLLSMRADAEMPPWWRPYGPRPDATATYLDVEPAARRMRSFNLSYVPGLLQIPEYARAIIQAVELDISRQELDKGVELRMQRQRQVFTDTTLEIEFIVDENALRRMPGAVEDRRAQLAKLRTPPDGVTVRVLPYSSGPHPAATGFTIFDLTFDDEDEIVQAVYAEWSATTKGVVEEGEDVQPYLQVWERVKPQTLPARESSQFLKHMMESVSDE